MDGVEKTESGLFIIRPGNSLYVRSDGEICFLCGKRPSVYSCCGKNRCILCVQGHMIHDHHAVIREPDKPVPASA
jgi:hypothetical protein